MEYLTLADVATFLGRSLTAAETSKLNLIIPGLCAAIEQFCNRSWVSGETNQVTELFTGPKTVLYTKNTPINSVVSFKINGVNSSDFVVRKKWVEVNLSDADEAELVYLSDAVFPPDLKLALTQWAGSLLADSTSAGKAVKRVQVGAVSTEYMANSEIPEFVTLVAKRYVLLAL